MRSMIATGLFGAIMLGTMSAASTESKAQPAPIRLWETAAPASKGSGPADIPTVTPYLPEAAKANGSAMVVCPGGGYGGLADHEGKPIAEWLNTLGVTAFVLKYRLGPTYHHPVEMEDAQRAMRLVRSRAAEWKLNPQRIGIIGFSAGGHLASTVATHFDAGDAGAADPIERASCRPDFAVLAYPVITMTDPFTHTGSRTNLLGANPSKELIDLLSNEKHVTKSTPPCFIVQTADDPVVFCENALMFAMACHQASVPVELHLYEHGPHGIGLGGTDPVLSTWPKLCALWMERLGILNAR